MYVHVNKNTLNNDVHTSVLLSTPCPPGQRGVFLEQVYGKSTVGINIIDSETGLKGHLSIETTLTFDWSVNCPYNTQHSDH